MIFTDKNISNTIRTFKNPMSKFEIFPLQGKPTSLSITDHWDGLSCIKHSAISDI